MQAGQISQELLKSCMCVAQACSCVHTQVAPAPSASTTLTVSQPASGDEDAQVRCAWLHKAEPLLTIHVHPTL